MPRISVVGTSGSGKTTLARQIASRLGIPHVELDALRHGPNWNETPDDVFRDRVAHALTGELWVVDGNYHVVRDIVWRRADTLVWLDYSFPVVMGRLTWRTLRRLVTREALWNGNRESLRLTLSRNSILLWLLKTYWRRRRQFPLLLSQPEHAHLTVVRLASPRQTRQWLFTVTLAVPYFVSNCDGASDESFDGG